MQGGEMNPATICIQANRRLNYMNEAPKQSNKEHDIPISGNIKSVKETGFLSL